MAISPGKFSRNTAISIVIANMVGTGVFTSLGFQLLDIQSAPVIILLWVVGGVLSLCGALCYAELGAALPRSGGEYNFLGQIYHPAAGFVSGWVSTTIGFAAPTALAAITSATYLNAVFEDIPVVGAAVALVLLVGMIHLGSRAGSARFQL
ncbi:MAG: amino acid permease, partial [Pseudomonadales bacterium]|nr:amino acid permease [Pseudomonadales bacterium]